MVKTTTKKWNQNIFYLIWQTKIWHKETIKLGKNFLEKGKLPRNKEIIDINDININDMFVSDKHPIGKRISIALAI